MFKAIAEEGVVEEPLARFSPEELQAAEGAAVEATAVEEVVGMGMVAVTTGTGAPIRGRVDMALKPMAGVKAIMVVGATVRVVEATIRVVPMAAVDMVVEAIRPPRWTIVEWCQILLYVIICTRLEYMVVVGVRQIAEPLPTTGGVELTTI